jgi:hypothetical protein
MPRSGTRIIPSPSGDSRTSSRKGRKKGTVDFSLRGFLPCPFEKLGGVMPVEAATEENSVVIKRAAMYGEKVRLAEDAVREDERKIHRAAWTELLNSIRCTPLEEPARAAYWEAYVWRDNALILLASWVRGMAAQQASETRRLEGSSGEVAPQARDEEARRYSG